MEIKQNNIYNRFENKNIICVPFAFKKNAQTGVNVKGDAYNAYLKNACVALCSAKEYNNECCVLLATNIKKEKIPQEYVNVLENKSVEIIEIPFDEFNFPDGYLWSLAFYKLCVLKYLSNSGAKNICYLDTDVYIQDSFENIWQESETNILLYDINHGLGIKDYKDFSEEVQSLCGKKNITHYGGEFFSASNILAKQFCKELNVVYEKMLETEFQTTKGDEFILSIAAHSLKEKIKNAGAYIFRFWTGARFRLVCNCYKYNRITILHMPNEKNKGILKLYKYIKKNKMPRDKKVWRICNLTRDSISNKTKRFIANIIK